MILFKLSSIDDTLTHQPLPDTLLYNHQHCSSLSELDLKTNLELQEYPVNKFYLLSDSICYLILHVVGSLPCFPTSMWGIYLPQNLNLPILPFLRSNFGEVDNLSHSRERLATPTRGSRPLMGCKHCFAEVQYLVVHNCKR